MDDEVERALRTERYRRELIAALEQMRPRTEIHWPEPWDLVNRLFWLLKEGCGEEAARQMFIEQGREKEPREQSEIANWALLQVYDVQMKVLGEAFSIMQFVKQVSANKKLPKLQQRGAGGTNPTAFYHHLNDLLKKREAKRRQEAMLLRQRQLRQLREGVDIWRRKLAEVSAAFAKASSDISKTSGPTTT